MKRLIQKLLHGTRECLRCQKRSWMASKWQSKVRMCPPMRESNNKKLANLKKTSLLNQHSQLDQSSQLQIKLLRKRDIQTRINQNKRRQNLSKILKTSKAIRKSKPSTKKKQLLTQKMRDSRSPLPPKKPKRKTRKMIMQLSTKFQSSKSQLNLRSPLKQTLSRRRNLTQVNPKKKRLNQVRTQMSIKVNLWRVLLLKRRKTLRIQTWRRSKIPWPTQKHKRREKEMMARLKTWIKCSIRKNQIPRKIQQISSVNSWRVQQWRIMWILTLIRKKTRNQLPNLRQKGIAKKVILVSRTTPKGNLMLMALL